MQKNNICNFTYQFCVNLQMLEARELIEDSCYSPPGFRKLISPPWASQAQADNVPADDSR